MGIRFDQTDFFCPTFHGRNIFSAKVGRTLMKEVRFGSTNNVFFAPIFRPRDSVVAVVPAGEEAKAS